MPKSAKCPRCGTLSPIGEEAVLSCAGCGARLKIGTPPAAAEQSNSDERVAAEKAKPKSDAPAPLSPKEKRKANRKKAQEANDRRVRKILLAGAAGGGLLALGLVVGLGIWLASGGKRGGAEGGDAVAGAEQREGMDDSDRLPVHAVVPLAEGEPELVAPQGKAGANRPQAGRAGAAESKELLPPAARRLAWAAKPDPEPDPAEKPDAAGKPVTIDLPTNSLVYAPGKPFLAVLTPNTLTFPVFDLRTGGKAGEFSMRAFSYQNVRLSPDGRLFAVMDLGRGSMIRVWKYGEPGPVATLKHPDNVVWYDFFPDGKRLAVATVKPGPFRFGVWEIGGGEPPAGRELPAELFAARKDKRGTENFPPVGVGGAVSPGGRYVVLSAGDRFVLFETESGRPVGDLPLPLLDPEPYWLRPEPYFTPDGRELRVVLSDGRESVRPRSVVACWGMADGSATGVFPLGDALANGPALDGDGPDQLVVSGDLSDRRDGRVVSRASPKPPSPGLVIDRKSGAVVNSFKYHPIARLPDGRLAGYESVETAPNETQGLFRNVRGARRSAVCAPMPPPPTEEEIAGKRQRDEERRRAEGTPWGDAVNGNRAAARAVAPQPPAQWSVPAPTRPAAAGLVDSVDLPADGAVAFAGERAAVAWLGRHEVGPGRKLFLAQLDLKAGKAAGKLLLASSLPAPDESQAAKERRRGQPEVPLSLALAADGKVAVRTEMEPARLDVWDAAGVRRASFRPYGASPPAWFGWSADGKLLTLGGGRLTGWDVANAKAAYEADGGYGGPPPVLSPERTWIALAAEGRIDLLDTATGQCLGRLEAWPAVLGLAASPDGKRLAALGPAPRGANGGSEGWRHVREWSLLDGSATGSADVPPSKALPFFWVGPRQLLVGGHQVIDLNIGWPTRDWVRENPLAKGVPLVVRGATLLPNPLAESPDGRPWFLSFPREALPGRKTEPTALYALSPPVEPPPGEVVFGRKVPLKVEVDYTGGRSAAVQGRLTAVLKDMNQTLGDGGWTLRMKAQEGTGMDELETALGRFKTPVVTVTADLVSAEGVVVESMGRPAVFARSGSKYYKGQTNRGPNSWTENYDFQGRGATEAILDELWQGVLRFRFYGKAVLRHEGKFTLLPVRDTVRQR